MLTTTQKTDRRNSGGVIYIVPGGALATDISAGSPRATACDGQWPGIVALPENLASMGDWTQVVAPSHPASCKTHQIFST
jgi:hypothetical protein